MRVAFLVAAVVLAAAHARAQAYPTKPILFVIPFAAGGDSDLSGRNVAHHASKYLDNKPIVSLNRVGASGAIGATAVRNAVPDGYTLLVARIATHAILPAIESKLAYKWNEFTMLSLIELNPYICFVRAESPLRSTADLIGAIRKNPGKLNFATAGAGTSQNMAAQYLMTLAGLTKDHAVGIHYKGGGEVTTAVVGGQVDFACNNVPTVIQHVKSGRLRALFVTPGRLQELPDAPSAREAGYPDMEKIVGWTALMGPPGLPKAIVTRWTDVLTQLARDPDWQAGNARLGGIAAIRSPAETERYVREQYELYDKLVTALGIRQ
ncbi:MAG TPA: tripartite tricarboxylate transporter substrate binding protein [Burkholderiales bacterium]|nr:tripartite tricarboxylate transporter substrate binding protein [Burkholderiales bacterium]